MLYATRIVVILFNLTVEATMLFGKQRDKIFLI